MTSILNNVAANTALLNLQNTVSNLNNIQGQISTGLKVSSAADSASYFSIASVLRADSSALSSVADSLNLGNSSLSVAANALKQIQTTLSDIKNKLVEATKPGADRSVIQEQIKQDQNQLQNIANSSNFNGQNFLAVDSSVNGYNSTKSFVSSYSRDSIGNISIGFIDVNTVRTALFDTGAVTAANSVGSTMTSTTASIANTDQRALTTAEGFDPLNAGGGGATTWAAALGGVGGTALVSGTADTGAITGAGQYTIRFATSDPNNAANQYTNDVTFNVGGLLDPTTPTNGDLTVTKGVAANVTNLATGDVVGGIATGGANSPAGVSGPSYNATTGTLTFFVVNHDETHAGAYQYDQVDVTGITLAKTGNGILDNINLSSEGQYRDSTGNMTYTTGGTGKSIVGMDVTNLTDSATDLSTLNAYQKQVDAAISKVASAASELGTAQSRIQVQTSFVTSLQSSINDGIGALVDADLNTVSTRLQALQVQQQLGVQSLSIANQSTQMILKLFQ
jgi:flagellin